MVVYFVRKEGKTILVLFGVCLCRKMYNKFFVFILQAGNQIGCFEKDQPLP